MESPRWLKVKCLGEGGTQTFDKVILHEISFFVKYFLVFFPRFLWGFRWVTLGSVGNIPDRFHDQLGLVPMDVVTALLGKWRMLEGVDKLLNLDICHH